MNEHNSFINISSLIFVLVKTNQQPRLIDDSRKDFTDRKGIEKQDLNDRQFGEKLTKFYEIIITIIFS